MSKKAWALSILVGTFVLIGTQFRCSQSNNTFQSQNSFIAATIKTQPADQTVIAPATATFSVAVTGTAPISYQWYLDGAKIVGATQSSYTTPATTPQLTGGSYSVQVQQTVTNGDPGGLPFFSDPALLTVYTSSSPNIYAGGSCYSPGPFQPQTTMAIPGYWLNGTWYGLPALSTAVGANIYNVNIASQVNAMVAASGGNIYAAGDNFSAAPVDVPGYWLNGTWYNLTPLDPSQNSSIQSLAVFEGDVVYAAGYSTNTGGNQIPGYWIIQPDGTSQWVGLPLSAKESVSFSGGQVNSIAVLGTNSSPSVYAAGLHIDTNGNEWPCIWLGGILYDLPTATGSAPAGTGSNAYSLSVAGDLVYVAGSSANMAGAVIPGYWVMTTSITEIGTLVPSTPTWTPLPFPTGSQLSSGSAYSIVASGTGFNVAGDLGVLTSTTAGVWQSGTWAALAPPADAITPWVSSLAVSGGAVYAGGYINSKSGFELQVPGLWLNGTWSALPPADPGQSGVVNSILIAGGLPTIVVPSGLAYSTNPASYTVGTLITPDTPIVTGGPVGAFTVSPALPAGLSLNPTTGVITGTPTAATTTNTSYTITATNLAGSTSVTFPITVATALLPPSNLMYTTSTIVDLLGETIPTDTPTSTGGAVAMYTVSPALPAGLSLDPGTGYILGTPTVVAATANYTVTASNAAGSTTAVLSITINNTPTIAPTNLTYTYSTATFTVGTAIATDTPSNGGGLVQMYGVSPPLPAGIHLDPGTGLITGTPTATAAMATYTVTASNLGGSTTASLTFTVTGPLQPPSSLMYTTSTIVDLLGETIPTDTPTSGGGAVAMYSVSPALPAGLSLDPSTGYILGTPTAVAATANYTVTASNAAGSTSAVLSITINNTPTIAPTNLTYTYSTATFTVGIAIATDTPSNGGGLVQSYGVSPPLPTGINLDPNTGLLTGTPTVAAAMASYTVTASNLGGSTTTSLALTVVVPTPLAAELALPPFVHPGDTWMEASVLPSANGLTYLWSLPPGTGTGSIASGQGTDVIGFAAGTTDGTFQVQANVQNGVGGNVTVQRTVTVQNGTWLVENGGPATVRSGATATLLPSGRVLVAGGVASYTTVLATAEIYDPATGRWFTTGAMGAARENHTATLLPDGTVLVAGGYNYTTGDLNSSEIYDPATGTWSPTTGPLGTARQTHAATLLADGTVLVAGGVGLSGNLVSCEIYTPSLGTWASTGSMAAARASHTATLLPDHTVLAAGGQGTGGALASSEVYTPASGTWATTPGALGAAREMHTATLLNDGTVLAAGGQGISGNSLASAEIYTPATGTWAPTGPMATPRANHTATLLQGGTVLAAGGANAYVSQGTAEIYNPAAGTWSTTAALTTPRSFQTAALLGDGTVLVAGGQNLNENLASSEIYNPAGPSWTPGTGLGSARQKHTATLLQDGTVLAAGGQTEGASYIATSLVYTAATRAWTPKGNLGTARSSHSATLLNDGTVLVAGGQGASGTLGTSEIYHPATGTWTATTGALNAPRYGHTATLLPNGSVLVAGGFGSLGALASAEIYTPSTGLWTSAGTMTAARIGHTATLVGGNVLVAGGGPGGLPLETAEIYSVSLNTWTPTGTMPTAHQYHTATLLNDGTVLVAGGQGSGGNTIANAELYDPTLGTWSATGFLAAARQYSAAILLPATGKVLAIGGWSYPGGAPITLAEVDIYDPVGKTWSITGPLGTARYYHTSTLLNDGTVLTAFGESADVVSEIYLP